MTNIPAFFALEVNPVFRKGKFLDYTIKGIAGAGFYLGYAAGIDKNIAFTYVFLVNTTAYFPCFLLIKTAGQGDMQIAVSRICRQKTGLLHYFYLIEFDG